jgi:hypothetical protein
MYSVKCSHFEWLQLAIVLCNVVIHLMSYGDKWQLFWHKIFTVHIAADIGVLKCILRY